jgi:hypothetical protein
MFYRIIDIHKFIMSSEFPQEFNTLSDFNSKDSNWEHCVPLADKEMVLLLKYRQIYQQYSNPDLPGDDSLEIPSDKPHSIVLGIGKYGIISSAASGKSLYRNHINRDPNIRIFFLTSSEQARLNSAVRYFNQLENENSLIQEVHYSALTA